MSIIDFNYSIDTTWVSASKTRNFLLNDQLIDYLKYNNMTDIINSKKRKRQYDISTTTSTKKIKHEDSFLSTILNNGIKFEQNIMNKLNEKFPNKIITIINTNTDTNIDNIRDPNYFKLTIDMIKKKVPIIYQGVLHNTVDKTFGVPDLIVRGDYVHKIVNVKPDNINNQAYYIIDIKNSQLHLSANSDNILNTSNVKPYKGQLLIYHQILSQIQNIDTGLSFILGNRWIRIKQNHTYNSHDPFDRFGIINYNNYDRPYIKLVDEAIKWERLIRDPTNNLNHLIPNHIYLYPNMCVQSEPRFKKIKLELADCNNEITSLWMCGVKHRENAFKHNINSWMDPKLNSKILGINGNNGKILDLIIGINQSTTKIMHPTIIKSNLNDWRNRNNLAFYIDFETINRTVFEVEKIDDSMNDIIFMIGIGYSINNKYKYRCLFIKDLSDSEQINIINQMITFLKKISNDNNVDYQNVNLYHWSNFEPLVLSKICTKFNIIYPIFRWTDILDMFHSEPIVIKGALNFSLKTVGKAMYKLGLIKTIWSTKCNVSDGLSAMYEAYKIYLNNKSVTTQMKQIIKYNKVDCKIMWEILNALNKIA